MCNPVQAAPQRAQGPPLLYYITDRRQFPGAAAEQERRLLQKIAECARAGVDYIQLREKDLSTRQLESLASQAMTAVGSKTKLLINSRIDVALACGASGVHLPGKYLAASEARAIFTGAGKADPIIAVSTHSVGEVASAESHGADFAVFGPVFEKSGATNTGGLEQLALVSARAQAATPRMPVLALGGVTPANAAQCLTAGASGIAAIRLFQDNDVADVVSKVRRLQPTAIWRSRSRG